MEGDLFNIVMSSLVDPKRGIEGFTKGRGTEYFKRHSQKNLLGSTKFIVSNKLLDHVVGASFVPPRDLMFAMENAIPPISNMWVEWDEVQRLKILDSWYDRFGLEHPPESKEGFEGRRVGYHIHVVNTMKKEKAYGFSPYFFTSDHSDKIYFPPITLGIVDEVTNPWNLVSEIHEKNKHVSDLILEGSLGSYLHKYRLSPSEKEFFTKRIRITEHSSMRLMVSGGMKDLYENSFIDDLVKHISNTIRGDLRFLMALFSMINYPNLIQTRDIDPRSVHKVSRVYHGRKVPKNELKVIEIDLPKPKGVKVYQKMFRGMGSPKRRHLRRGHFNFYKLKDGTYRKVWIEERFVGTAEFGTIEHDYKLTSKYN